MTRLADHPLADLWLAQFSPSERIAAMGVLGSLTLVSHSELWKQLSRLLLALPFSKKSRVALFPVKAPTAPFGTRPRSKHTSAGRIGHSLQSFERARRNRFAIEPTIASMRAERTKDIVLVDDMVGSGTRIVKFWSEFATPTLRSWLSFGYCKLWLVTYASDLAGEAHIREEITFLTKQRLHSHLEIGGSKTWPAGALAFFKRVGALTSKPGAAFGYRNRMSDLVFQHGCPNTVPASLWANGSGYRALFPEREVPADFDTCFGPQAESRLPERLWSARQFNLALKLSDQLERGKISSRAALLLTLLGLRLKGVGVKRLASIMACGKKELARALALAGESGFLSPSGAVTPAGRELVAAFRRRTATPSGLRVIERAEQFYYPSSYRGSAKI